MATFTERDPFSPITYTYTVQGTLFQGRSAYQEITVFESEFFGRMLVLDDVVQLTERDEHYYHEMLAHVPLCAHPNPKRVLVIGGGDGGTLREVLKHPGVEEALLVELDADVIAVSRRFFPALAVAFDDPRARIVVEEGSAFLDRHDTPFDVILVDSTDPIGPGENLFTEAFYRSAYERLAPDGILASQTESLHFHRDFVGTVQRRLSRVFPIVDLYTTPLATYAGNWWTFSIASKLVDPREACTTLDAKLGYYSADIHQYAFGPRSLRDRLLSAAVG